MDSGITMNRGEDVGKREKTSLESEFCVLQNNVKNGTEDGAVPILLRCLGNEDSSLEQETSEERPLDTLDVDSQNINLFSPSRCSNGYNSKAVHTIRRLSIKGRRLEPYRLEPYSLDPDPKTPMGDKLGVTVLTHFTTLGGGGESSPSVRADGQHDMKPMDCQTPFGREYRIPPVLVCPGAPRKRQVARRLRMSESIRNLLRPLDFDSCPTLEPVSVQ